MGQTIVKQLLTTFVDVTAIQVTIILAPKFRDVFRFVSADPVFDHQIAVKHDTPEGFVVSRLRVGLSYHAVKDVVHVP